MGLLFKFSRHVNISLSFFLVQLITILNVRADYEVKKECHPDTPNIHGKTFKGLDRMGENSKYFFRDQAIVPETEPLLDFASAKKYCESIGMRLGVIKTVEDYRSIDKALKKKHPGSVSYPWVYLTGSYKFADQSEWWDADNDRATFQNFLAFEPYSGSAKIILNHTEYRTVTDRDYEVLMLYEKRADMQGAEFSHVMRDAPYHWNYKLCVICQLNLVSPCYNNSDETKANNNIKDEMKSVGSSDSREYFIGSTQRNFDGAEKWCEKEGMKVLDLELTKEKESNTLYEIMSTFVNKNDFAAKATSFFLSGLFTAMFQGDGTVPFEWEWMDGERECNTGNYNFNYFRNQNGKKGKCMSIGALYKNKKTFTLSQADCIINRWVMCYKELHENGWSRAFNTPLSGGDRSESSEESYPAKFRFQKKFRVYQRNRSNVGRQRRPNRLHPKFKSHFVNGVKPVQRPTQNGISVDIKKQPTAEIPLLPQVSLPKSTPIPQVVIYEPQSIPQRFPIQDPSLQTPIEEPQIIQQQLSPIENQLLEQPAPIENQLLEQPAPIENQLLEQPAPIENQLLEQPAPIENQLLEQPALIENQLLEQPAPIENQLLEQPAPIENQLLEQPAPIENQLLEQPQAQNNGPQPNGQQIEMIMEPSVQLQIEPPIIQQNEQQIILDQQPLSIHENMNELQAIQEPIQSNNFVGPNQYNEQNALKSNIDNPNSFQDQSINPVNLQPEDNFQQMNENGKRSSFSPDTHVNFIPHRDYEKDDFGDRNRNYNNRYPQYNQLQKPAEDAT